MAELTEEQKAAKAEKEAKAAAAKAEKEAKASKKYKVNFGAYIPHMRKEYTVEEIEASEEVQEYLHSIGSPCVTKL